MNVLTVSVRTSGPLLTGVSSVSRLEASLASKIFISHIKILYHTT